ncbi:MAG: cytochrome c biogenesis heme-transporting ATPase CcmA [Gammaproteobacteria bacterium]|nr:MAG: cytochrome c biogenesis heme-transporting ATPase CcmA [Gammaproteobacteria bacterium]
MEAREVCCSRGDRQLFRCLNFDLASGELMYLRGPNGSGKTTLLRTLAGLLRAETGEIRWDGKPIHQVREAYHHELLYLGHLNALKEDLNPVENLRMDAAVRANPLAEDAAWQLLANIGLRGCEDLPVKYLSQGQKRRVALARLWVSRAALWILDEPFSALDVASVDALQAVIRAHLSRGGMAILTTHQEVELTSGTVCLVTLGSDLPEVRHA